MPARLRALTLTVILFAARTSLPQAAPTNTPQAQQLEVLLAAQQTALATNDPASILVASKPLAALALRLAATLDINNNPAAARDLLTRSVTLDPQPASLLLLLTADLTASPQSVSADVGSFLHLTGDTAAAHLLLAQTFQAADDLDGTIHQLQAALALDPNLPSAHFLLGNAFWQLNEFQYNPDSLREFTLAQQADPTSYLPNLDLASLLSQYHHFPEAARYLTLATQADPVSPDPSFQLGMDLFSQSDYAAARPALERAVQLTGADTSRNSFQIRRALSALSRIAALAGQPAEAERLDRKAEQLHQQLLATGAAPTLSESVLLVGAGGSHATAKSPATATAAPGSTAPNPLRQRLLTIAASALNDAGTSLARSHDFAAALPLFREAASADPTLPPVLRNLGLAAFHTNDLAEARSALTRALQLDPADTLARRYLDQIPPATPTTP